MTRLSKTAEEIREEISRLIHEKPGVKDDHARIGVSLPTELLELDPQGAAIGSCLWFAAIGAGMRVTSLTRSRMLRADGTSGLLSPGSAAHSHDLPKPNGLAAGER
jgi:hypothetical protein